MDPTSSAAIAVCWHTRFTCCGCVRGAPVYSRRELQICSDVSVDPGRNSSGPSDAASRCSVWYRLHQPGPLRYTAKTAALSFKPACPLALFALRAHLRACLRVGSRRGDSSIAQMMDYTPPSYITLIFTEIGILTPSAVSDELIKLYL